MIDDPFGRGWAAAAMAVLPAPDTAALAAAGRAKDAIERLLRASGSVALTIARTRDGGRVRTRLFCWRPHDRRLLIAPFVPDGADRRVLSLCVQRVAHDMTPLLIDLERRWPAFAVPPTVDVVTEGRLIAMSQFHPSATDATWLDDHIDGAATITVLCDLAAAPNPLAAHRPAVEIN